MQNRRSLLKTLVGAIAGCAAGPKLLKAAAEENYIGSAEPVRSAEPLAVPRKFLVPLPNPHPGQEPLCHIECKHKIARAGRRSGLTTAAVIIAIESFLKGRRVLYVAPNIDGLDTFQARVRRSLSNAINCMACYEDKKRHLIKNSDREVGNWIRSKVAWNDNMLRGTYADLIIFDGWQLMHESVWEEVGAPMLVDNGGDAVFLYTPLTPESQKASHERDANHADKMFSLAEAEMKMAAIEHRPSRWLALSFGTGVNPHISKEALNEVSSQMDIISYRKEILGEG